MRISETSAGVPTIDPMPPAAIPITKRVQNDGGIDFPVSLSIVVNLSWSAINTPRRVVVYVA
jgi:hypothetical protein